MDGLVAPAGIAAEETMKGRTGTVFYKMTGSGNDFVMLDGRHAPADQWPAASIRLVCDRRHGVGADGLVLVTPEGAGRVRMKYFNSDGSVAALCGNAALCATRLAAFLELAPAEGMTLLTDAGEMASRCTGDGHLAEIRFPAFELPRPVAIQPAPGESAHFLGSVGVPHLVVVTDGIEEVAIATRGPELRHPPLAGPDGANVNFVAPPRGGDGLPWQIRTWERGIEGETLACGTGTVAAAFALAGAGLRELPSEWETQAGIRLAVSGTTAGEGSLDAWLCGEGRLVYTGILR